MKSNDKEGAEDVKLPVPNLRDWFAGQALIMAGAFNLENAQPVFGTIPVAEEIAKNAYSLADAMLAEREKRR